MGIVLAVDSSSTTLALLPEMEPVLAAVDYRLVMITVPADPAAASQRVNQLIQEGIAGLLCCPTIYQATVTIAAGRCPVIVLWAGAAKAMLATLNDPMASQTPAPAPPAAAAPVTMTPPPPSPVAATPATKPTPIAPPPVAAIPLVIIPAPTLQPEPESFIAPTAAVVPEPPPVITIPEPEPAVTSPEPAATTPSTTEQPDNSTTTSPSASEVLVETAPALETVADAERGGAIPDASTPIEPADKPEGENAG
jgi:hypothetical protein